MLQPVTNGCLWSAAVAIAVLAMVDDSQAQRATDAVGEVIMVHGAATVTHEGEQAPVKPQVRQPLFARDRIDTGERSAVKALFRDDSLLTLGERTRLELAEYAYDAGRKVRRVTLTLTQGMVRALVGQSFAAPASAFSIQAGPATIDVRATYVVVWTDEEGTGVVNIGTVGLVQFTAGGQGLTVNPGHFSIAPAGQPPRASQTAKGKIPAMVSRVIAATDLKEDVGPEIQQFAEQPVEEELPSCPPGSPPGGVCPRRPPPSGIPPATPPAVTSGAVRK
jgi:hypothetical protein